MGDINSRLTEYVTDPASLFHRWYCGHLDWTRTGQATARRIYDRQITRLFTALNPESRLNAATMLAEHIFCPAHAWPEIAFFRRVLRNRELAGEMRYNRYRDHTLHSMTAFVLGAFMYENAPDFRRALDRSLDDRMVEIATRDAIRRRRKQPVHYARFANAMQELLVTTLAHDIGYLFEGDYSPTNPWRSSQDVQRAAAAIADYYAHEWPRQFLRGDTRLADRLFAELPHPAIATVSVSTAAAALRSVVRLTPTGPETANAFDLFADSNPGNAEWEHAVRCMEYAYHQLAWEGIPGARPSRAVIDHGIATGLILLQLASYFYTVCYRAQKKDPLGKDLLRAMRWTDDVLMGPLDEDRYRASVRRICGAAFHNLDPAWFGAWGKSRDFKTTCKKSPFPIDPDALPLLYLPMLLDAVQDWDRQAFPQDPDRTQLDGCDVTCATSKGLHLQVADHRDAQIAARKMRSAMSLRLTRWRSFLRVL